MSADSAWNLFWAIFWAVVFVVAGFVWYPKLTMIVVFAAIVALLVTMATSNYYKGKTGKWR